MPNKKAITIKFARKQITKSLLCLVVFLAFASVAGQYFKYFVSNGRLARAVDLFYSGKESSIPTWYSSVALLFCSLLLALIAFVKQSGGFRYVRSWYILSIIFLFLSLDEVAMFHETMGMVLRQFFNTSGALYYRWVIIGIPLTFLFLLSYARFIAALPTKTRWLFLLSGTIFVGGALGMEMTAANYASLHGEDNMIYALLTTLEEFCEMLGIVIFIDALLSHLCLYINNLHFYLDAKKISAQTEPFKPTNDGEMHEL
jgi:hypothetical protein